jgi:hypothetical protein
LEFIGIVFSNCGGGGGDQTEIPCRGHEKPQFLQKVAKKWIYALD